MSPAPASPALRRWSLAALVANVGIVLTGGVVRVTGSGLGCADWPRCDGASWVPVEGVATDLHAAIEFGNRMLTFVLVTVAVGVFVAAWRHRAERRDLFWLATAQPVGVVLQAAWGGLTVLTDLHPLVVASHFLLSALLVATAVVLVARGHGRHVTASPSAASSRWLGRVGVVSGFAVLVLGTLVTGSGPHAGDAAAPRLGLDIRTMAVAHADAVWLLVGVTIALAIVARTTGDRRLERAVWLLAALEIGQGSVGYVQYAVGVPAGLVAVHILGAIGVWAAAVHVSVVAHARATPTSPTKLARVAARESQPA